MSQSLTIEAYVSEFEEAVKANKPESEFTDREYAGKLFSEGKTSETVSLSTSFLVDVARLMRIAEGQPKRVVVSDAMEKFLKIYLAKDDQKDSFLGQFLRIGWPVSHFEKLFIKPKDVSCIKDNCSPTQHNNGMFVYFLYLLADCDEEIIIGLRPEKLLLGWLSRVVRKSGIRFIRKYSE